MLVWILNSRTASTLGRSVIDSVRRSLLSMPSYRKLLEPSRLPFEKQFRTGARIVRASTAHDGSGSAESDTGYTRSKRCELNKVSSIQRQLGDLLVLDDLADG